MAIIPQNVYYGIKTKYLNKFKIDYQGTVATVSDLPEGDVPKGTVYNVEANGSNYLWNGEEWDELGTSDENVVHKNGNEIIEGVKNFKGVQGSNFPVAIDTANNSFGIVLSSYRDTENKSFAFLQRYRTNTAQGANDSNSVFYLGLSENAAYISRLRFSSTYKVSDSQVQVQSIFTPYDKTVGSQSVPVTFTTDLGIEAHPWENIFCETGPWSSSDARTKLDVSAISDAVLDAWSGVDFKLFKFKKAVSQKGEDARIHAGLIAQDVETAFEAEGLDATRFGFISVAPNVPDEETDENGIDQTIDGKRSIRYEEALVLECAYQRRRADRLEARIAALEEKLK